MDNFLEINKQADHYLNFLKTEYNFITKERKVAYEYSYIFKTKKVYLEFTTELGSIILPTIIFKIRNVNVDLIKFSNENNLKQLIRKNIIRTKPIMDESIKNYFLDENLKNDNMTIDFNENGKIEIKDLMNEIQIIFLSNSGLLKGNLRTLLKSKI